MTSVALLGVSVGVNGAGVGLGVGSIAVGAGVNATRVGVGVGNISDGSGVDCTTVGVGDDVTACVLELSEHAMASRSIVVKKAK